MIWSNLWYGLNLFKPSRTTLNMQTSNNAYIPIGTNIINTNISRTQYIPLNSIEKPIKNPVIGYDERYNKTNNNDEEIFQNYLNMNKKYLLNFLQSDKCCIPVKLELLMYYKFLFDEYPRSSIMNGGLFDDYNFEDF